MTEINVKRAIHSLKVLKDIQGQKGNFDYSEYMGGLYNGIELSLATLENREPIYRPVQNHDKMQIDRLADFIMENFGHEIGRGNPKEGESAVEVAIRLLSRQKNAVNMPSKNPHFDQDDQD